MTTPFNALVCCAATALAAIVSVTAHAQLFKWVDEQGRTHYSDRKPDDAKTAAGVRTVSGNVSVYAPDQALLRAVEAARERASRPEPVAPVPQGAYVAPASVAQQPLQDPCVQADCAAAYYPAFPVAGFVPRRRPPPLVQAQLPPGATAGTVNSPGIIPGNSGSVGNLLPREPAGPSRHARIAMPREPARRLPGY